MTRRAYATVVATSGAFTAAAIVVAAASDDYDAVAALLVGAVLCAVFGALGERRWGR